MGGSMTATALVFPFSKAIRTGHSLCGLLQGRFVDLGNTNSQLRAVRFKAWQQERHPLQGTTEAICISYVLYNIIEGSLEIKHPTIWTDEKQSREEAERRGRLEERRVEEKE